MFKYLFSLKYSVHIMTSVTYESSIKARSVIRTVIGSFTAEPKEQADFSLRVQSRSPN